MNPVPLTPPRGKVIIRKDEPVYLTPGGIYLKPNDRAKSFTGTIATGAEAGQRIYFVPRVSSTINFRGENLVIISDDDIIGTI